MKYEFAGQLTRGEFRHIMRVGASPFIKFLPFLLILGLIGVAATGGYSVVVQNPVDQLPRLALALGFIVFLLVAPELAIRKSWKTNQSVREQFRGAVTIDGIEWFGPYSQGFYPWRALYGYRLRQGLCLVYSSSNQAIWLMPRLFLAKDEWRLAISLIK